MSSSPPPPPPPALAPVRQQQQPPPVNRPDNANDDEHNEHPADDSSSASLQEQRQAPATLPMSNTNPITRALSSSSSEDDDDNHSSLLNCRTLYQDLQEHLCDEDISDIFLKGSDGKLVPAARCILAMRSRFFKSLLFGNFREKEANEVPLGYSSLVLKAVVEYCYTDEIKTTFENLGFEETARSLVGLVAAGNYLDLGGLMSRAYRLTCLMMDEYPALACAVLDESMVHHESLPITAELSRVALGIIRLRTESALLPPDMSGLGVQSLGAVAMERIMADDNIETNELALFHCLKKWAEHDDSSQPESDKTSCTKHNNRRAVALQLASRIDFSKISPSDLCTVVADSGLVALELLAAAYREQALQAERQGYMFAQLRSSFSYSSNTDSTCASGGKVILQGAGLSAVNGTYRCSPVSSSSQLFTSSPASPPSQIFDSSNSVARYSRTGRLLGCGMGEFFLHTCVLQDDTKKWFLTFRGGPARLRLDLYSAPVLSEHDPPPMQKWSAVSQSHIQLQRVLNNQKNAVGVKGVIKSTNQQTSGSSSRNDDSSDAGDPPPICIWLPDEPER